MLSSPFGSTVDHHRPDYRNDHPCHHGCHIHRQQHLRTCPIAHQRTRIKRWPEKWGARPNVWSIGLPEQQIGRLVAQNPWKDFKSFPREKKVSFECQSSFRIRRMKGCKLQPMCVCLGDSWLWKNDTRPRYDGKSFMEPFEKKTFEKVAQLGTLEEL